MTDNHEVQPPNVEAERGNMPNEPQPNEFEQPNRQAWNSIVCGCDISTRKFGSLGSMVVTLLLGVVFLVAWKADTDKGGTHVHEYPVYRYLTIMLFISIVWMGITIFSRFIPGRWRDKWLSSHEEPENPLIPRRLLIGVMFFGLGSSFMTMVELLEFTEWLDCPSPDPTMMLYYVVRTIFIYTQLYFFYKLSGYSKKILYGSHFLLMHLIAVNLATWIVTFVHDSAEELQSETTESHASSMSNPSRTDLFMAYHWGITLANGTTNKTVGTEKCHNTAEELKSTAKKMEPYFYTFTMEYCLLSAGLLLNVWLSLRSGIPEEPGGHEDNREYESDVISEYEHVEDHQSVQEVGTLWRFGFIFGLAYVPVFVAVAFNVMFSDTKHKDQLIYVGFQFIFFMSILLASWLGSVQLDKQEQGEIHSKVDFYLLGGAMVGVFFLDMFIIVAAFCEVKEWPGLASLLIVTNFVELASSVCFTHFVYKALQRKLPSVKSECVLLSASRIREVVSFLFMLNICFWAMYTFEVKKSSKVLKLPEEFYTKKVWFYISHIVYPLAVFFHFHGAVCMVEILNHYSKVPVKDSASEASIRVPNGHAVQA